MKQPMKGNFKRYVDQITQNVLVLGKLNQDQSYWNSKTNVTVPLRINLNTAVAVVLRLACG
jgi:hypothetical protein